MVVTGDDSPELREATVSLGVWKYVAKEN